MRQDRCRARAADLIGRSQWLGEANGLANGASPTNMLLWRQSRPHGAVHSGVTRNEAFSRNQDPLQTKFGCHIKLAVPSHRTREEF